MKILNNSETIAIAKEVIKQIPSYGEYKTITIDQLYQNQHSQALIEDPRNNHLLGRIKKIKISSEEQHKQYLEDESEVLKYLVNEGFAELIKDSNCIKLTDKGRLFKKGTIILKVIFNKIYPINLRSIIMIIGSIISFIGVSITVIIGMLTEEQKIDIGKWITSIYKNIIFNQ
jgi:hypothetical protein